MHIPEEHTFISSFDRPNISLEVLPGRKRLQQIQSFLNKVPNQSGIIYCLSRRSTESVAESLNNLGFKAEPYHGGINADKRSKIQENFINDETPIIVATIAFGMGIDKSNVRWVIHYNMPSNVESFYQEIGRAGRDGTPAQTALFYSFADIVTRTDMIKSSELPEEQKELMLAKLDRMKQYAEANICRRRILISYFNEDLGKDCGNCDVCKNPRKKFDATVLAQKALSAIFRTNQKVALTMLVDVLRGSRNQSVMNKGYDQLPTFGVGKDLKAEIWVDYILQLLNYGAFDIAYDEGHTFKLNEVSRQILKGLRKVEISEFISYAERQTAEVEQISRTASKSEQIKGELFEKLRTLRKQIADAIGSPAYIVFSDATLVDMAAKKPITKSQFLEVSGVGLEKFKRFGEAFIKEIFEFVNQNKESAARMGKGLTQAVSFQLYQDGYSVEEIAQQRSIAQSTVISHLIKMKEDGNDIDLKALIDPWDLNAIKDAIEEIGFKKGDGIKTIFEHFEGNMGYEKIRLTLWFLSLG